MLKYFEVKSNMEDVLVELEGRVEEGANFVLELVDHLSKYFSNTF